jgi:hypothetical protein
VEKVEETLLEFKKVARVKATRADQLGGEILFCMGKDGQRV